MITKFSYTARADDIYEFYNFWAKQRRTGTLVYILALVWLAPVAYTAISEGEYMWPAIYAAAFALATAFFFIILRSRIKQNISRLIKLDKTYLCKTDVTVFENAIEMQTDAPEGEAQVTEIYPFELLCSAYETQGHFYLIFVNNEAKVIPKDSIPEESAEKLSREISKNPTYKFISQEKK